MMRRHTFPVLAAAASALLLAGCFPRPDYSGVPDMSSLMVTAWEDQVSLSEAPAPQDARRHRIAAFTQSLPQGASTRYVLLLPPRADAGVYRPWAEALGAVPGRTSLVRRPEGTLPVLKITATSVAPPDCDTMQLPPSQVQHDRRATFAFGCATRGNLAAMIDDPVDLVAPTDFAGPTATREAAAVRRYLNDQTKPLMKTTISKN